MVNHHFYWVNIAGVGYIYIYTYILGFCLAIAQLKVQKKT